MKVRTCKGETLITGQSKCPMNREKIVGAIIVPRGYKLPSELTGANLEQACHADGAARIIPLAEFVEYSKNGGEVNVAVTGYGANQATGVSAMTDAYTLDKYNENANASLLKTLNSQYDVYFYDRNNVIYGLDDGTEQLAGFPMSCIYPTPTPFPTSSAEPSIVVNFCYKDARSALENANYEQVDFNIASFVYGLTPVKVVEVTANNYKIVEAVGGLDRTPEFAAIIGSTPSSVLATPATGVTYTAATDTITIASSGTKPKLKAPSALYTAGIKGIVEV